MKKFALKLLIFMVPFLLYVIIVTLIDPYSFFGTNNFIKIETKRSISLRLNPQLWKMIEYDHHPVNRIILGDSRSAIINVEQLRNYTGDTIYNFSFPGGTLIDIIEAFWYAAERNNLKEVYIGINFNLYNDFEKNNNVKQAVSIMKNPIEYSFSKIILNSMIQILIKQLFNNNSFGIPDMSKDDFWNYQLNVMAKRFYNRYKHPTKYYEQLLEISEYCNKNNIKLTLFSPPTHIDLQKKIADFNLLNNNKVFLNEISSLGTFYNFDTLNIFTQNKTNFHDPFHPISDSIIIHSLWKPKKKYIY